jgi:hypothetical protein
MGCKRPASRRGDQGGDVATPSPSPRQAGDPESLSPGGTRLGSLGRQALECSTLETRSEQRPRKAATAVAISTSVLCGKWAMAALRDGRTGVVVLAIRLGAGAVWRTRERLTRGAARGGADGRVSAVARPAPDARGRQRCAVSKLDPRTLAREGRGDSGCSPARLTLPCSRQAPPRGSRPWGGLIPSRPVELSRASRTRGCPGIAARRRDAL